MNDFICYCFEHTADDIEQDYLENGKSTIMEKIQMEKKFGNCQCTTKNPKGKWCLGDVHQVVAKLKGDPPPNFRSLQAEGGILMKNDLKHKLYMGFRGLMMRIPPLLSEAGARKGEKGAKANADSLSKAERNVHHFIVMKMAVVNAPITAELIAGELGMPSDQVIEIINKLEGLKTFIYRSDGKGINWAYPLSLENTGFSLKASSGEQFFAAWAADAFAAPFVYGKLKKRELSFTIQAECAHSGRQMKISLDSELNINEVTDGADPMFCLPIVPLANTKEPSIVDVFWRKSLLFWSEEDVRDYKKKKGDLRVYMNLSKRALAGIKRMQTSIFDFW